MPVGLPRDKVVNTPSIVTSITNFISSVTIPGLGTDAGIRQINYTEPACCPSLTVPVIAPLAHTNPGGNPFGLESSQRMPGIEGAEINVPEL
jgi:hypothetical protein